MSDTKITDHHVSPMYNSEKVSADTAPAKTSQHSLHMPDAFQHDITEKINQHILNIKFTEQDIAAIANTFAALIGDNPHIDRKKYAHLFAQTILEKKKIGRLLSKLDKKTLDDMCEQIADSLDLSPKFAQFVENIYQGSK